MLKKDKTLILGASTNASRYSNKAAHKLLGKGFPFALIGKSGGELLGGRIEQKTHNWQDIDTVTLYINPKHQKAYYDYVVSLKPSRVIFNPGTENSEFEKILLEEEIEVVRACTLVMLASGQY